MHLPTDHLSSVPGGRHLEKEQLGEATLLEKKSGLCKQKKLT